MRRVQGRFPVLLARSVMLGAFLYAAAMSGTPETGTKPTPHARHAPAKSGTRRTAAPSLVRPMRGRFTSVQVNVDAEGNNILGDAANEPSLAVDPTDAYRIVIGWVERYSDGGAPVAYSSDGGETWTAGGLLDPQTPRSDPIVRADAGGRFFYFSIRHDFRGGLFRSQDGGESWLPRVDALSGDKPWMTIDQGSAMGQGNVYIVARSPYVARSTDGGDTFSYCYFQEAEFPGAWTVTVDTQGNLYGAGGSSAAPASIVVSRSGNARDPQASPFTFNQKIDVNIGGAVRWGGVPSPGLLGQVWIAADHGGGPCRGRVYLLASVEPLLPGDPLDVMFSRSLDGGRTWSPPRRINDDAPGTGAWQWFGTLAVAPNGRVDVIWNDTRCDPSGETSELFYSYSHDAGDTWSPNEAVSPPFNSRVSFAKLEDYYDMHSDDRGAVVAYAATFNGEHDIYFVRLTPDCNNNRAGDDVDVATGTSADCSGNGIPDECEPDCNGNGHPDSCDLRAGTSADFTGNAIPDECELDIDGDRLPDECDGDSDGDGVPNLTDSCEYAPVGFLHLSDGRPVADANHNCVIDQNDHRAVVRCLKRGGPGGGGLPVICVPALDFDADLDVDLADAAVFQSVMTRACPDTSFPACP